MARIAHNKGVFKHPLGHTHSWIDRNCEACGKAFRTQVRRVAMGGGRFCSKPCNPSYPKAQPPSAKARRNNLKTKYGITEAEYDEMVILQAGRCAICGKPPAVKSKKYRRLVVDHCHKDGVTRKLLCTQCNIMLGMARDRPDLLRAGAAYLEEHNSR